MIEKEFQPEFIGQLIDTCEDFLTDHSVSLYAEPQVNSDGEPVIIARDDYDELYHGIWSVLDAFGILNAQTAPVMEHSDYLEFVCRLIEAFEEFLDKRGFDVPNDEKDGDPCACNIYGTDYGEMESGFGSILRNWNAVIDEGAA